MQVTTNNKRGVEKHDDLNIENIDSTISYMKSLVEGLLNAISVLPKVDEEGNSECPFAEDLYAQKEEAAEKVEAELPKLRGYVGVVEQEIARCEANLQEINADSGSLNLPEAKGKYNEAVRAQETQYKKAIGQRKALTDTISRAEEALSLSRSKAFPVRKPQKSYHPPVGGFGGGGTPWSTDIADRAFQGRPSFKREMDNLISLGPLGRKDT
jgi:hypothetical protein